MSVTPREALKELMAGNARFVQMQPSHPHQDVAYLRSLVKKQKPIAAILGCSDSRVPAELVFDQGFGDLFVVRVAGNVMDEVVLASMEFAVGSLEVGLIVVMGHSRCGAVSATIKAEALPSHLPELARRIQPAVDRVRDAPGDLLENATCMNAKMVAEQLREHSDILREAVEARTLKIVSAYYDLQSGEVKFLDLPADLTSNE